MEPYFEWVNLNRQKRCNKCVYGTPTNCDYDGCDYIGITGKKRPCPPGDQCTVFVEGKKIIKKKQISME